MNELKTELYQRFVKYASVDTTSDPTQKTTPTTSSQMMFAKMLADEMPSAGFTDVEMDEYGFVTATIEANTDKPAPTVGFFAHMDTVCDFNGKGITPILHENYQGGNVVINEAKKMYLTPETSPSLKRCIGHDLVTSDGTSILAGDDKLGISVIMTFAHYLKNHPEVKHGKIRVAFTVDEETGTGIAYFDVDRFDAEFAYTIDGGQLGEIDYGNFNADKFEIAIQGKNCHPGSAKDFMANPVRIAADIVSSWPENRLPETTEKEEGFILFMGMDGNLEHATLRGIVRDHDLTKFENSKKELQDIINQKLQKYPNAKITVQFTKQYRNMKDVLEEKPQAMNVLKRALEDAGIEYNLAQVRGGTDGAQLTFRGLPTPNIFAGYENPHGPYEWLSLDWTEKVFHIMKYIVTDLVK